MSDKPPITILDAGMGNVGSVRNMIRRVGGIAHLTSSPEDVERGEKLILPGIGSFDAGMTALRERNLDTAIRDAVVRGGAMILGICLGMHLLLESSEEGELSGLRLVPGRARRFQPGEPSLRVPHMGWNTVLPAASSALFDCDAEEQKFYFVHSYYVECDEPQDVVGITHYGHEFVSAFARGQVMGVQFHPEKSHKFGMDLLERFVEA